MAAAAFFSGFFSGEKLLQKAGKGTAENAETFASKKKKPNRIGTIRLYAYFILMDCPMEMALSDMSFNLLNSSTVVPKRFEMEYKVSPFVTS